MTKTKQNINVLSIADAYLVGGRENLLLDMISDENTKKCNISYFVFIRTGDYIQNSLDKLESACPKIFFGSNKSVIARIKTVFNLIHVIKTNKINILLTHDCSSMYWAVFCKVLFPGLRIINVVHGVNVVDGYGRLKVFLANIFVRTNAAISDSVKKHCQSYNLKNVLTIYNGIKLSNFNPRSVRTEESTDPVFKIINVGRLHLAEKGQDILIKALDECSKKRLNYHCYFVGEPFVQEPDAGIVLESLVKKLNLNDKISFLGHRNDIPELLSQCHLFVLPSRFEGFGLTIIEAMASKLPVIASNQGGPADLITHGQNGLLFEKENHIDLAKNIMFLYNDKEERRRIAEEGYKFAQKFDISNTCEQYCNLYFNVLKN